MPKFENLEAIRDDVEAHDDVLTLRMAHVRDAHGAGRLGVHVRDAISKRLAGLGLAHYPVQLPDGQDEMVRVYKQGSATADLIDAVLVPSEGHDDELRQAIGGNPQEIIDRIRELVCD